MAFPPLRPAAVALLATGLIAGCAASGGGTTAAGTRQQAAPGAAGSPPGPPASAGPGAPGAPAASGTPDATAPPTPGAGAGCAPWPSGSARTVLLIAAGSEGQSYCVRTGQTVRVLLSGPRAIAAGSGPPRLLGSALAAEQVHLPALPSVSYLAVHPGTAALIIVRLPCHTTRPAQSAASAGIGALARAGGAPVGAECTIELALRVSITVR